MLSKFYKKLVYISFYIIFSTTISCNGQLNLINNNHLFRENVSLNDTKIYKHLDDYFTLLNQAKLVEQTMIICSDEDLYSKNVKNYFISSIISDSDLYELPCTGYVIYKEKVILIYSKKIGFINPVNYPKSFLEKVNKQLDCFWFKRVNRYTNEVCKKKSGIVFLGHNSHYSINNDIKTVLKYNKFWLGEFMFNDKFASYTDFVNLDNFRTIYVENCED